MLFEDSVGEDGLSSQTHYKVTLIVHIIKLPLSKSKILNDLKPRKEHLEKIMGKL
jgi:hypothetical protein